MEGNIDGRRCSITIDTGSDITIIRSDLVEKGNIDCNPGIEWMSTVTGEKAPIHGRRRLTLEIGSLQIQHDMVVAGIKDECILGTDFLTPNRCVVDLENRVLILNNEQVPLLRTKSTTPTCSKVTMDITIYLPPMSEAVACGRLLHRSENMTWGILEPDNLQSKALDGLLVARTLVDLDTGKVPVCLLNLTDQPKRIKKKAIVVICNPKSVYVDHTDVDCCSGCCCGGECKEIKH